LTACGGDLAWNFDALFPIDSALSRLGASGTQTQRIKTATSAPRQGLDVASPVSARVLTPQSDLQTTAEDASVVYSRPQAVIPQGVASSKMYGRAPSGLPGYPLGSYVSPNEYAPTAAHSYSSRGYPMPGTGSVAYGGWNAADDAVIQHQQRLLEQQQRALEEQQRYAQQMMGYMAPQRNQSVAALQSYMYGEEQQRRAAQEQVPLQDQRNNQAIMRQAAALSAQGVNPYSLMRQTVPDAAMQSYMNSYYSQVPQQMSSSAQMHQREMFDSWGRPIGTNMEWDRGLSSYDQRLAYRQRQRPGATWGAAMQPYGASSSVPNLPAASTAPAVKLGSEKSSATAVQVSVAPSVLSNDPLDAIAGGTHLAATYPVNVISSSDSVPAVNNPVIGSENPVPPSAAVALLDAEARDDVSLMNPDSGLLSSGYAGSFQSQFVAPVSDSGLQAQAASRFSGGSLTLSGSIPR
jgi:hypothetical protein